jgi:hypothetical protein
MRTELVFDFKLEIENGRKIESLRVCSTYPAGNWGPSRD